MPVLIHDVGQGDCEKEMANVTYHILPINGPGIICVGETALILDGSLKGNSKLHEVRHPVIGRKSEMYCSIEWKVPMSVEMAGENYCTARSDH